MSGRCKDCVFWHNIVMFHKGRATECDDSVTCWSGKLRHTGLAPAYIPIDGVGFGCLSQCETIGIGVGPEFGCVHFKEKANAGQDQGQEVDGEGAQAVEEGEREGWSCGGDGCGEEVDVEAGEEGVSNQRKCHCRICGAEVIAGPYIAPEACGACQLAANAESERKAKGDRDLVTQLRMRPYNNPSFWMLEAADEIERLRRLLTPVRPDTDIEEGKPLSTPNDYLSLLSSYIADYMPSEAVPDDEYFGAWERAARPILQRLFDEIERLRALSVRATEKE